MLTTTSSQVIGMKNTHRQVCVPKSKASADIETSYSPQQYALAGGGGRKKDVYFEARNLLSQWTAARIVSENDTEDVDLVSSMLQVPNQPIRKPDWKELDEELTEFTRKVRKPSNLPQRKPPNCRQPRTSFQRGLASCGDAEYQNETKEKPSQNTLDRMLLHFEESRARRELRRQEEQRRAHKLLIQREAELEAAEMVRLEEEASELLQERMRQEEEILCIRRKMNLVGGSTPTERRDPDNTELSDTQLVQDRSDGTQYDKANQQSLLRAAFYTWMASANVNRSSKSTNQSTSNRHLLGIVFHAWNTLVAKTHIERELNQARQLDQELERIGEQRLSNIRNETLALNLYQKFLKRRMFRDWWTNVRAMKTQRSLTEREELRQQKEAEFLNKLNTWSTKIHDDADQTYDLEYLVPVNNKMVSAQQNRAALSTVQQSKLSSALSQQRQRIAEQHREIERLKLEKRKAELMLEAKEKMLKERSLIQARKRPVHATQSVVPWRSETAEHRKHQIRLCNSAASSPRQMEINLTSPRYSSKAPLPNNSARSESDTPRHSKALPKNPFLIRMEEQAAKRAAVRAEREERRRLAEEKKREQHARELADEERRLQEEKQALLQARRAKQLEEEKKRRQHELQILRQRELDEKAARHRDRQSLWYFGWLPWKRHLSTQRANLARARNHKECQLQRITLQAWSGYVREKHARITAVIVKVHNEILVRNCFNHFRLVVQKAQELEAQAFAWYEQQLLRRALSGWSTHVTSLRIWEWKLEDVSRTHRNYALKRRVFSSWTRLPALMEEERERERRRERLRDKLRDLVPDFSPPKVTR